MKKIICVITLIITLIACRPGLDPEMDIKASSPGYNFSEIFESFWLGMDRNYVYWSEEPSSLWAPLLDQLPKKDRDLILKHPESFWDEAYKSYKPRF